jgi:hypothetical protein
MKIKVHLSIGYVTADQEDTIDVPDEELEGLSDTMKDKVIEEWVQEWANNYIETWWDKV